MLFPFILTILSGLSTLLGNILMFIKINKNLNKYIAYLLYITSFIMIYISIVDLIPVGGIYILNILLFPLNIIISILLMFLAIKSIAIINKKTEDNNNLYQLGILSLIILTLHNIPEGIITYISSSSNTTIGIKLCIVIALHNIPEGIAICLPIYYATNSKLKAFLYTLIAGISEPFGALITYLFLYKYINNFNISILLVYVGFLMLILAINKIIPEANKYYKRVGEFY